MGENLRSVIWDFFMHESLLPLLMNAYHSPLAPWFASIWPPPLQLPQSILPTTTDVSLTLTDPPEGAQSSRLYSHLSASLLWKSHPRMLSAPVALADLTWFSAAPRLAIYSGNGHEPCIRLGTQWGTVSRNWALFLWKPGATYCS